MSLFYTVMQKYIFSDAQKLLIKPSERLQFTFLYVLVTIVSYQLVDFLTRYFFGDSLGFRASDQIRTTLEYSDPVKIAIALMLGGLTGLSQWIVLRKYIPNPQWIFVTLTYGGWNAILQILYDSKVSSLLNVKMLPNDTNQFTFTLISLSLIHLISLFVYGYGQHYVIAPYVRKFRWWLWIPLTSLVFRGSMIGFGYLIRPLLPASPTFAEQFQFDSIFFMNAGSFLIPTIAFCSLYRRSITNQSEDPTPNPTLDPNFNLAVAPDLVDFWKIRSIQQTIEQKINRIWKTDLDGDQDLAYFIGVDQSGEIVACIPQTQTAIDRFQYTPLPALVKEPIQESSSVLNQPIAKFNLTFSPPAISKLVSCRGIPRRELFGAIALILFVLSMIVPHLGI